MTDADEGPSHLEIEFATLADILGSSVRGTDTDLGTPGPTEQANGVIWGTVTGTSINHNVTCLYRKLILLI